MKRRVPNPFPKIPMRERVVPALVPPWSMVSAKWLAAVRKLPCAMCAQAGPNHAHHATGRGKGLGTKNDDHATLPLCWKCHHGLHSLSGPFKGWKRQKLQDWQAMRVQQTQVLVRRALRRAA